MIAAGGLPRAPSSEPDDRAAGASEGAARHDQEASNEAPTENLASASPQDTKRKQDCLSMGQLQAKPETGPSKAPEAGEQIRDPSVIAASSEQPPLVEPRRQPARQQAKAMQLKSRQPSREVIAGSAVASGVHQQQPKLKRKNNLNNSLAARGVVRPQSALAGSCSSQAASGTKPKTTRVRINSTSEQIQDPNWLIRMSLELEQANLNKVAQNKAKGHLKSLQRKLKSTITNVTSGGSTSEPEQSAFSAGSAPIARPSTPVKMPVSILKQRNTGTHEAQASQTQVANNLNSQTTRNKSPVPSPRSSASAAAASVAASPKHRQLPMALEAQKRTSPTKSSPLAQAAAKAQSPKVSRVKTQSPQVTRPQSTAALGGAPEGAQDESNSSKQSSVVRAVPICADGQVRVSGWKRNNLLAKTLSHFDEIRGNQRPVFMPTKITLPPELDAQARPIRAAGNKFADVVREAISRKNQLGADQVPEPKPKTTRVRINSTSEQIQDPNWLIRMSLELEQANLNKVAQNKAKGHLKSLQRKLKSTITNVTSGGSTSEPEQSAFSAGSAPIARPSTPVKMPVSILKQRNTGTHEAQASQTQVANNLNSQTTRNKSPVPSPRSSASAAAASVAASPKHRQLPMALEAQKRTSPTKSSPLAQAAAKAQSPKVSRVKTQSPQVTRPQSTAALGGAPEGAQDESNSSKQSSVVRAVPICADGQVRVSGWKRNNLLAKTLSHFDEIRGNQRPVFMPTKITLPPELDAQARPIRAAGNKFADVVREAISRKNQLGADQVPEPNQTGLARTASKRLSEGGEPSPVAHKHMSSTLGDQVRAVSAEPSQTQPHHLQHRSSSSVGVCPVSPSPVSGQQASPVKQQVPSGKASQSGHSSGLTSGPNIVSQFLLSTTSNLLMSDSSPSSRQFKLQQKNNQVLQNLRRQSNEVQASQQVAHEEASAGGKLHIKDWKRLTGKLALLTSRSPSKSRLSSTNLGSNKDINVDFLSAPTQMPLRLTVSNQEQSSSSSSRKGQNGSTSRLLELLMPESQSRKLSSSSMVVQSSSGAQAFQSFRSAANSPKLSTGLATSQAQGLGLPSDTTCPHRRSSDSEAYRRAHSTGPSAAPESPERQAEPLASGARSDGKASEPSVGPVAGAAPVVVHRDDLIQLLHVYSENGVATASKRGSGSSAVFEGPEATASQSAGAARVHLNGSLQAAEQVFLKDIEGPSSGSDDRRDSRVDLMQANSLECAQKPAPENPDKPQTGQCRKGEDLSRIVRKSSKVAFFQEKLRKMRWHKKTSGCVGESSEPKSEIVAIGSGPETLATIAHEEKPMDGSQGTLKEGSGAYEGEWPASSLGDGPKEVFMDPALIGDAIEIFLRSTMQSNPAEGQRDQSERLSGSSGAN